MVTEKDFEIGDVIYELSGEIASTIDNDNFDKLAKNAIDWRDQQK